MSLHMLENMARLTVLGTGWSDASAISGDGFTFEGELWMDIGDLLDFSFPDDVEWDQIAITEPELNIPEIIYTAPDIDDAWIDPFTDLVYPDGGIPIYTDDDGNIFTDPDLDGIFTDIDTGDPFDGDGDLHYIIPDEPYYFDDETGLPYLFDSDTGLYLDPINGDEWDGVGDLIDPPDLTGVYIDPAGTGTWTDPSTGVNFNGIGSMWIPEDMLLDMSVGLTDIANSDSSLARYSIPDDVIPSLFSGKVTSEITPTETGSDRPHLYSPAVWYLQKSYSDGWIFLGESFVHTNATGGDITVYDESIAIREGSSKAVYWSSCTTHFWDNYLPSPYSGYPIQYVCWQCLYGSFSNYLITQTADTITPDDIRNGTTGLDTMTIGEKRYYRMKDSQVANRV